MHICILCAYTHKCSIHMNLFRTWIFCYSKQKSILHVLVLECPQALYFLLPNIVSWKFLQTIVALGNLTRFIKSCPKLDRYYVFNLCCKTILSLDNKYMCEDFHHFERLKIFVSLKISIKVFHLLVGEWNFLPFENLQVLNKEANQSLPMGFITWNLLRRVSILDWARDGVETFYYSCFLRMPWQKYPNMKLVQMDLDELLIHTLHYRLEKPNLKCPVQVSDIINKAWGLFLEFHC